MPLLEDVGSALVTQALVTDTDAWIATLAPGTDQNAAMLAYRGPPFLFRYTIPDTLAATVTLEDYSGLPASRTHDGPDVALPRVAITVGGVVGDAVTPHGVAMAIWTYLNATINIVLNGVLYESLWPLQSGLVPLGMDVNNRFRYRINIEARHNL
ncbi:MAG: hypothetical protein LC793_12300 [Thermomicrobia bacterium]|nr:hypothetical protein [Thermomicrobia bacterium]MCA1722649.1 hypothetical protein [Thermomicrobia bacterium]